MKKYEIWYNQICSRGQSRKINGYTEIHHIVPKSFFKVYDKKNGWLLGNPDEITNLTVLTAREHSIVHWLLTKIYTIGAARHKVLSAFQMLAVENPLQEGRRYKLNSRAYATAKEAFAKVHSEWMSGDNNPMKDHEVKVRHQTAVDNRGPTLGMTGKNHTEETKSLMREKRSLQEEMSEESRKAISSWMKFVVSDPNYVNPMDRPGVREKHSQSTIDKFNNPKNYHFCEHCQENIYSAAYALWHGDYCKMNPNKLERSRKVVIDDIVVCPHCEKSGGIRAMGRWHFDNCRYKT